MSGIPSEVNSASPIGLAVGPDARPLRSKREIIEAAEKPPRTVVNSDGIPCALRSHKNWVLWKWGLAKPDKNGVRRWTKVPYTIKGTKAKPNDPKTWATFDQVKLIFEGDPQYDGIGYVFSPDDPFTGIDLDNAIDLQTGALKPWALEIVSDLNTLTEVSPTFTGVKLIAGGKKPAEAERCKCAFHDGEVEIYDQWHFFTITGDHGPDTPTDITDCSSKIATLYNQLFPAKEDAKPDQPTQAPPQSETPRLQNDDALLEKARNADDGDKFGRLYDRGDTGDYEGDDSRADMALACKLAFWTDRDAARMDRLFRRSALMRPKWDERRGKSTYGERTIQEACEFVSETYRPRQSRPRIGSKPSVNGHHEEDDKKHRFSVGPLALQPGQPRQTPSGKITIPVNATREGRIVYPFVLSNAASGCRVPERMLRQLIGEDPSVDQINTVLMAILAYGADRLTRQETPSGPTIREIVAGKIPEALQLVCRSEHGLWSEALGEDVRRSDIIAFTPDWLINECGKASDAPRDVTGVAVRAEVIRLVQVELGVVWADLLSTLPPAADVDLGRETERGRQFRLAMIRIWKTPRTWEKTATPASDTATKASLVSRVNTKFRRREPTARIAWEPVHPAIDVWWRPHIFPNGEMRPLLGMRWTLPTTAEIDLPGVIDEESLTRLGKRFGVIGDPPEGVPSRLSGGKNRLAVLTVDFCGELLETPSEDTEQNPREPGAEG